MEAVGIILFFIGVVSFAIFAVSSVAFIMYTKGTHEREETAKMALVGGFTSVVTWLIFFSVFL